MAHSPDIKAQAMADLAQGLTHEAVAQKYGVSKATITKWATKVSSDLANIATKDNAIRRRHAFLEKFADMMDAVVEMNTAHAKMLTDPNFCKDKPASELNDYAYGIVRRIERIFKLTQIADPEPRQMGGGPGRVRH